ncbi:universal stress protein [Rhodococcus artemisiae]|uniref:Universal stress protein n=1 Tax=Rhodococcus artemisiae TaxID=714159 RepID=A0ABU7LB83_9NOCA|nr:universal stress protein [Rhodococcus artemisiae]MEE2058802.1 universal stress protein [Rhodococcus artemisiae]
MTIAVAYSDSAEGRAALLAAAAEASLRTTELFVLHVGDGDETTPAPDLVDEIRGRVDSALNEGGTHVSWTLRTAGRGHNVAGALVDLVAETGSDMLVLGSRRRSATGKFLLGSTVQRVVLDCPVPVLTVKAPES